MGWIRELSKDFQEELAFIGAWFLLSGVVVFLLLGIVILYLWLRSFSP